jgi:hypothetical protein
MNKLLRRQLALLLPVLLLGATSVHADLNSQQRLHAFAALPDWTGFWEQDSVRLGANGISKFKPLMGHPPYNAEWEAKFQAAPGPAAHVICSLGFPAIMDSPYSQFELVVLPEQTLFIPVDFSSTRQIFTDGRAHPPKEDLWPTPIGDSIGHWEGQTLVVDTISRKAGPISVGNELSDQAHFIERIRLVDKNRLEDVMTIEDPIALMRPWQVTLTYRKIKDVDRLIPYECSENDRNPIVNGHFTIAPPKPK